MIISNGAGIKPLCLHETLNVVLHFELKDADIYAYRFGE